MKKKMLMLAMTAAMTMAMSVNAFAAGWQKNDTGWWYGTNADNSTWHSNGWQWVDGNGDGTAECYYFDGNGYILTNTTTPDGYQVNADGAWVVNGNVQTKNNGGSEVKSAEEILDYLENRSDGGTFFEIDHSRQPVASGATNIKNGVKKRNCWTYICCKDLGGNLCCPVAFDENGYLLVNTTTPDGYYVNEYGILEIDGVEVIHSGEYCMNFPVWKNDVRDIYGNVVTDPNHCDLSKINLNANMHDINGDIGAEIPFGKLMYMHVLSQRIDGGGEIKLGFNYCAQNSKELRPKTSGRDVGPEPHTFR